MDFFPTYLAFGQAFCNRKDEMARLQYNIENHCPSLIMSPRRYGKTSLALNVLKKTKRPFCHIDLYQELSEEGVERAILQGIGSLVGQLESRPQHLLKIASEFFADLEVKVVVDKAGIALDFSRNNNKAADNIGVALMRLQALVKQKKRPVVLFMDEFQVLAEMAKNHAIEASIRHMAQQPDGISYIFSGSNRHLLQDMFFDKNRPFYKLCDTIYLQRISADHYKRHFQKAAKHRWAKKLSDDLMQHILDVTECHPYYVNKLCSLIWRGDYPSLKVVKQHWRHYVLENISVTEREMALMSLNQRKLLIYLARHAATTSPYSTAFSKSLPMSSGSLSQALKVLMQRDYIYKNTDGYYCILDPLLKSVLSDGRTVDALPA